MSKERYEILHRLHTAEGKLAYTLAVFGDTIAKREGYRSGLEGMEAVHFYLVHKFGWPLPQVRAMNAEDIRFVLQEEMHGFTHPKGAIFR
ncbi:TPA: hypothetical protein L3709_005937 [Pseudomonas aeruginosa]|uniref:hypothetical protein n=1 Tax=Pseudomonas aeruginosa TaxID=287 RepID=UPI000F523B8E|nr:hypothetical protein [Pseudomonas aeruginosa]RPS59476.1 hypothetical protein IPC991_30295 [Pseudomonas aeruginosa]HBN8473745.1 hypothetical protein [Pseudomonas aeruginosa]